MKEKAPKQTKTEDKKIEKTVEPNEAKVAINEDHLDVADDNDTKADDGTENGQKLPTKKSKRSSSNTEKLNVVCIGASAGGLEAINAFFDKVPDNPGLSFVLVQHLSPDYKSMMPELLAKHTKLKISKVVNNMQVEQNCIYTLPPDNNIFINKGRLYLEARGNPKSLNLPINNFLKSLAEDQKERAIAVVLSGTGSDGTLGIESVKENGGMVMAQDPNSAAFDNMPKSAIATGLVDFILHPSRMPDAIIKYVKHPYIKELKHLSGDDGDKGDILHQILTLLHQKTRLDFRLYKKATVIRRIERRMSIRNILNKDLYLRYLKDDPDELDLLGNDILIGVTGFFRDTKAFESLDKLVLYQLVKDAVDKDIRIWVVGCSTGQEVYSLAMLLKEQFRKQRKSPSVKIFATDIDQRAIDRASKGIYAETVIEEIPKPLLLKYFTKVNETYHVKKELRQMVIFARHDISKDPPFNNIDLACCRNLLIYIEPPLQEKILTYIHFSLNANSYLFLGSSETPGMLSNAFEEVNKKYKIYKNCMTTRIIDVHRLNPFEKSKKPTLEPIKKTSPRLLNETKIVSNFKDALLEDMIPATVFINESMDVVHVAGDVDKYIKLPRKQLTLNVLKMVDEQIYVSLSNAISKVKSHKKKFISPLVEYNYNDEKKYIKIVSKPYTEPNSKNSYIIVSFNELEHTTTISTSSDSKSVKSDQSKEKDAHIRRLEEELKETKEYLQSTIEELETSNEELQATNEELMAANEELQSSNEELQSVNEELYTVNNEFENKLIEMTELNDDLKNFLQSTHIATLFLDNDLNIKRFTNAITSLIKLNSNDIGRYVGDFSNEFKDFNLSEISQSVLRNFTAIEKEVVTKKDEVFLMQALPYVTSKKEIKGVVFTFVDVNQLKKIESQLMLKAEELERSNIELEQFAYLASHDLKAPITNLDSLMKIIEENDFMKKDGYDVFSKLKNAVQRMQKTISTLNEVIAVKKNLDLKSEKVELKKLLDDVLEDVEEEIKSSKAHININLDQCSTALFPPVHLHNILQNLITNAIKYKKLGVKPEIDIISSKEAGYCCISIQDNGRGINLENYGNKLFGLFQRFHLDIEGKGIGLHITKSIIEKYGGKIEVSSIEGKGTTFQIYLKER
ncbi:CheR family methyltransferase [Fulvivirga ligni]|uniref:CheR family methyltransferase n=1 Tax=Fulvivirga ligni TaxID=2904246 RepID=UPI001F1E65C0|nr:CheR family methyltransferase [Fulvivirga ligni]UII24187.1 PAS domain-containing protein [Fulvivirga ligni]